MSWSRRRSEGSCSVCGGQIKAKGLCDTHYLQMRRNGEAKLITKQEVKTCEWEGCSSPVRACGYCRHHYKVARRENLLHPGKYKRDHPLYGMWWARRKAGMLAPEWADNFDRFVSDTGPRPGANYSLVTLGDGPFGPANFQWKMQLKRDAGETLKAFNARKWQAQKSARPSWDRHRQIKRKYGLTPQEYEEMLGRQKGVCAICQKTEPHKISLAIDHCHTTGKVRGLLCTRCNTTIGRIGESLELLRSMEMYMQRHLNNQLL